MYIIVFSSVYIIFTAPMDTESDVLQIINPIDNEASAAVSLSTDYLGVLQVSEQVYIGIYDYIYD